MSNTGRVAFTYSADRSQLSRKNVVEILPAKGIVQAGDKQRILVRVLPGLPEQLTETFHLQIAHFPPEQVRQRMQNGPRHVQGVLTVFFRSAGGGFG